jgi:hypothetical protein
MRCEACQGKGRVVWHYLDEGDEILPCRECGGQGIVSCCEPQAMPDRVEGYSDEETTR